LQYSKKMANFAPAKMTVSEKNILVYLALAWLFCASAAGAGLQSVPPDSADISLSPKPANEEIADTSVLANHFPDVSADSIAADSVATATTPPKNSSAVDAQIDYTANDSIVLFADGTGLLYGQGDVTYKQINLKADYIRVKMDSSILFARGMPDSLGVVSGKPEFTEGERSFNSNELSYNLKTKRAFVRQAVTQEGEGYIISERTKMNEDQLLSIYHGKYTTCDNHDCPHFYLAISKGKVKTGEYIVSGPAQMYLADMPLPLIIPFGYFPFNKSYSSGLLMPSYADEMTRGLGLINGGYYFAINNYVDAEIRSEIYTRGTWALSLTSSYLKRYKYRGTVNVSYREDVTGEKDMPDYNKAKNLNISWQHSQDAKADPYSTLSASVNFSTSGYNRSNINSYYNPQANSQNTKSSTIQFSKRFPRIPSLNITGNIGINQTTRDSTISMTLPNLSIAYSSTKPFKRKNPMGNERWYEKITISYSATFENSINRIKEDRLLKSSFKRDWENGFKHSIPISATFNLFNYINISPSISYTGRLYTRSVQRSWDEVLGKEMRDTTNGLFYVQDFSFTVSASTKVYGYFVPIKGIKKLLGLDMVRHVITPSIGFSWRPDFGTPFWKYYDSYTRLTPNRDNPAIYDEAQVIYSYYEGMKYGIPGRGRSQNLNFSLGNNLEAKFVNKNDTTGKKPYNVVSLIDNFSLSGSYNMAADSFKLSTIGAQLRIKFGKFYTLNLSTSLDPYDYALNRDSLPVRVNRFTWKEGRFPRWSGVGSSFSYTLNNDTFKKLFSKKDKTKDTPATDSAEEDAPLNAGLDVSMNDLTQQQAGEEQKNENTADYDGYEKVAIPWSVGISYSVMVHPSTKKEDFIYEKMRYKNIFTHNLSMSFSLGLGQNWSANTSVTYDFDAKKFSSMTFNVRRNLHCWSMSASFVPFGIYKSYNFHIGVNAAMLQDLKYDRQSRNPNKITWY